MAVNERSGEIVQITEGGYWGRLNVARMSMNLYHLKKPLERKGPREIIEVNLAKLFADSMAGTLNDESEFSEVAGQFLPSFEQAEIWHWTLMKNGSGFVSEVKKQWNTLLKVPKFKTTS